VLQAPLGASRRPRAVPRLRRLDDARGRPRILRVHARPTGANGRPPWMTCSSTSTTRAPRLAATPSNGPRGTVTRAATRAFCTHSFSRCGLPHRFSGPVSDGLGGHRRLRIRLWTPRCFPSPFRAAPTVGEIHSPSRDLFDRGPRLVLLQRHGGGVLPWNLGRRAGRSLDLASRACDGAREDGSWLRDWKLGLWGSSLGRHATRRCDLDRRSRPLGRRPSPTKKGRAARPLPSSRAQGHPLPPP